MKHFYDTKDVQRLLGCGTLRTAQARVKAMNDELKAKGYWTERGKVPIAFFHEKYPFIPRPSNQNTGGYQGKGSDEPC